MLFWLLDETKNNACLNVHEAEVPEELLQKHGVSESHLIPLKQIICVICQHNTYTIPRIYTQSESALLTLFRSTRCATCSQGYGGLLKFASFKNVFWLLGRNSCSIIYFCSHCF